MWRFCVETFNWTTVIGFVYSNQEIVAPYYKRFIASGFGVVLSEILATRIALSPHR